ncbi:SA1362 family protein [Robertmurraya massiliosenegalensis]|uniref:SA1362 family protein n=1 Tax=Robertmurraya TaxID=2837507 RepID=UPI0039A4B5CC
MAFLKNQASFYFVAGLIVLAIIGIVSRFIASPTSFLTNIFVFLIIGFGIFFLVRRFYGAGPQKREQHAFKKAAKRSKKRLQQKDTRKPSSKTISGNVSSFKRTSTKPKSATHLTVIEGRKGKKKKRASY